jgi:thioesterase domain-containing protein
MDKPNSPRLCCVNTEKERHPMSYNPNAPTAKPVPRKPAPEGFDSIARLMHLAAVADTQAAAARDLQKRRNGISEEIAVKRLEQARFTETPNINPARFAAVGEEIAALKAQRDTLDAAQRIAANAATDALRLHESRSLFAHQNGLPRPSNLTSGAGMTEGAFQ